MNRYISYARIICTNTYTHVYTHSFDRSRHKSGPEFPVSVNTDDLQRMQGMQGLLYFKRKINTPQNTFSQNTVKKLFTYPRREQMTYRGCTHNIYMTINVYMTIYYTQNTPRRGQRTYRGCTHNIYMTIKVYMTIYYIQFCPTHSFHT